MSNNEELKRKYDLVANEVYPNLRQEYLNFIVNKATSQVSSELIRGMLLLINESDKWEQNFLVARRKLDNKEE